MQSVRLAHCLISEFRNQESKQPQSMNRQWQSTPLELNLFTKSQETKLNKTESVTEVHHADVKDSKHSKARYESNEYHVITAYGINDAQISQAHGLRTSGIDKDEEEDDNLKMHQMEIRESRTHEEHHDIDSSKKDSPHQMEQIPVGINQRIGEYNHGSGSARQDESYFNYQEVKRSQTSIAEAHHAEGRSKEGKLYQTTQMSGEITVLFDEEDQDSDSTFPVGRRNKVTSGEDLDTSSSKKEETHQNIEKSVGESKMRTDYKNNIKETEQSSHVRIRQEITEKEKSSKEGNLDNGWRIKMSNDEKVDVIGVNQRPHTTLDEILELRKIESWELVNNASNFYKQSEMKKNSIEEIYESDGNANRNTEPVETEDDESTMAERYPSYDTLIGENNRNEIANEKIFSKNHLLTMLAMNRKIGNDIDVGVDNSGQNKESIQNMDPISTMVKSNVNMNYTKVPSKITGTQKTETLLGGPPDDTVRLISKIDLGERKIMFDIGDRENHKKNDPVTEKKMKTQENKKDIVTNNYENDLNMDQITGESKASFDMDYSNDSSAQKDHFPLQLLTEMQSQISEDGVNIRNEILHKREHVVGSHRTVVGEQDNGSSSSTNYFLAELLEPIKSQTNDDDLLTQEDNARNKNNPNPDGEQGVSESEKNFRNTGTRNPTPQDLEMWNTTFDRLSENNVKTSEKMKEETNITKLTGPEPDLDAHTDKIMKSKFSPLNSTHDNSNLYGYHADEHEQDYKIKVHRDPVHHSSKRNEKNIEMVNKLVSLKMSKVSNPNQNSHNFAKITIFADQVKNYEKDENLKQSYIKSDEVVSYNQTGVEIHSFLVKKDSTQEDSRKNDSGAMAADSLLGQQKIAEKLQIDIDAFDNFVPGMLKIDSAEFKSDKIMLASSYIEADSEDALYPQPENYNGITENDNSTDEMPSVSSKHSSTSTKSPTEITHESMESSIISSGLEAQSGSKLTLEDADLKKQQNLLSQPLDRSTECEEHKAINVSKNKSHKTQSSYNNGPVISEKTSLKSEKDSLLPFKKDSSWSLIPETGRFATIKTTLTIREPFIFEKILNELQMRKYTNYISDIQNTQSSDPSTGQDVKNVKTDPRTLTGSLDMSTSVTENDYDAWYDDYDDYDDSEMCEYFLTREVKLNSFYTSDTEKDSEEQDWEYQPVDIVNEEVIVNLPEEKLEELSKQKLIMSVSERAAQTQYRRHEKPLLAACAEKVPFTCDISVFIPIITYMYIKSLFI